MEHGRRKNYNMKTQRMMDMETKLTDFEYQGQTITLKTPIELEISEVNGYYYVSNNEIELYGNGITEAVAIKNARENFSNLYELSKKIINLVE
ncbi:MAG: hypothetical protein ABFC34_03315 [Methanobacterium sp.]